MTMRVFLAQAARPLLRLMARWPLAVKLWLAAGLAALPMLAAVVPLVGGWWAEARLARSELAGLAVVDALVRLNAELQVLAGARQRLAAGEPVRAELDAARLRSQHALKRVDAGVAAADALALAPAWTAQRKPLAALIDAPADAAAPARAFEPASAQAPLRELVQLVAERARLPLDPVASTHALMNLAVDRSTPWIESIGRVQASVAALLAGGAHPSAERAVLLTELRGLERQMGNTQAQQNALVRAGVLMPTAWHLARESSARLIDQARRLAADAGAGALPTGMPAPTHAYTPAQMAQLAGEAQAAVLRLHDEVSTRLGEQLEHRAASASVAIVLALLGWVLSQALLAGVAYGLAIGFVRALGLLKRDLRGMAEGDLSRYVTAVGRDELGSIGPSVEHMSARLSAMVAEIRSSAVRVGQAGQTMADDGQALAQRTEAQSATLRASLGTIDRLSVAASVHARSAAELDELTNMLRERVDNGSTTMSEAVESVQALEDSARRVAEVNGVIDDIAFQTNLLALNASVEAARAGEAGKGFAVVAAEVRQLAQRCSDAAAEVRALIEQTNRQVADSSDRIQTTHAALATVTGIVNDVSKRLREMAEANAQQSAGLAEVRERVDGLDDITRENEQSVQKSTQAAVALVGQADALRRAVGSIKLRQGSADEARALVERAMRRIDEIGFEQAAEEFNAAGGAFVDRDMYLFAFDRQGVYRVAGGQAPLLGTSLHDRPGVSYEQAEDFFTKAWAAAARGQGWIDYRGTDPQTGLPARKSAYVAAVNDEVFLGCGIYRGGEDDLAAGERTGNDFSAWASGELGALDSATAGA
ncbi:MAG: hypothetical protein HY855_11065 [Burkholderiales bacterium]|nr:hypothetical protein [Burkholderiales bacterium]